LQDFLERRKGMFERYTERARRVIFWAKYVASQEGSTEIETEHLLLGLLREDMSLARRCLGSPFAVDAVWKQVERGKTIREKPLGAGDLPLSSVSKRVLTFAAEEADQLSSKRIGTGHLLLGLLREEKCFAAEILHERGVYLASTREELARMPHDDSVAEKFVREEVSPPEVVELQARIRLIRSRMENAVAKHDFLTARVHSDEERTERDKLYLLCQQHGLSDWLYV
jgi:ATP-dependent Clp protease ATP-binding subunit ClpA